jgi:hypothetical protein
MTVITLKMRDPAFLTGASAGGACLCGKGGGGIGVVLSFEANIKDHSQIVRFVSRFIADGFVGISRGRALMGVGLHSDAVLRQPKEGSTPT